MLCKNNSLSHFFFFNTLLINKFFSKYIYTKFLIRKKKLKKRKIYSISIDNFFDNFFFCLKKKYKKLNSKMVFKTGFFLKADLFIYRHSKLKLYNFKSIRFKSYLKKNIYLDIKYIKNSLNNLGILFIFRSVRGGFLGFSNKIVGFLTLKHFILFKKNVIFYNNYFVVSVATLIPFNITNFSTLSISISGFKRKYSSLKKKKLSSFYFNRIKFIFTCKKYFLKKSLKLLFNSFKFLYFYDLNKLLYFFFLKIILFFK